MKRFPQEIHDFIVANVKGRTSKHLAELVSTEFSISFTESQVKTFKSSHGLKSGIPCGGVAGRATKQFPQEVKDYILENHKGIIFADMAQLLNETFGTNYTAGQINSYYGNHGLTNGIDCRFKKGQVSHNKGRKGITFPGSEKGWFPKNNTPHNHRPVGSERVDNNDGYTYVKIAEPKTWRLKHQLVWEEAHGTVPEGYILIFKDGDRGNITVDNLALVTRAEHLELTRSGLRTSDADLTGTGILISRVKVKANELKKHKGDGGGK